jgi:sugar phosphate isomerase/epimerase
MKMNRRAFIGGAAALSTVRIGLSDSSTKRSPAGALKLGIATYSMRKFPREQAIEMLGEIGTEYVSIKSFHLPYELSLPEVTAGAKQFTNAGMTILSGGNIDLRKPEELRKMFEYAKAAGMPMMVCAPTHATLDAVEKLVAEFNIKTAIHNHGPEDEHFPSPETVLKAIEKRDPRMGLCIDVGHTTRTGADLLEWVRRAGPRLFDIHIKDLRDLMDKDSQCEVGDGAMPVVALFQQLKAMNYQGGIMLEYEIKADKPLPGMIKSVAYMRGVLDGLAA